MAEPRHALLAETTPPARGWRAHVMPVLALSATLAVQLAQVLVSAPPDAYGGSGAPLWHGALTLAQAVLVVAAAYGIRPTQGSSLTH